MPQQTTPLTKFIRTTEGWLVLAASTLLTIISAVGDLPWAHTATAVTALAGASAICRTALKLVALLSPITPGATVPTTAEVLPTEPS